MVNLVRTILPVEELRVEQLLWLLWMLFHELGLLWAHLSRESAQLHHRAALYHPRYLSVSHFGSLRPDAGSHEVPQWCGADQAAQERQNGWVTLTAMVAAHVVVTVVAGKKGDSDGMLEYQVVVAEPAKPTDRSLETGNTTAVGMVWQKRVPKVAATGLGYLLGEDLLASVIAFHKSETGTIRGRLGR